MHRLLDARVAVHTIEFAVDGFIEKIRRKCRQGDFLAVHLADLVLAMTIHAIRVGNDFRRAKASWEKGETSFTPPISLVYGLREALRMIAEEGLANVVARHRRLSSALRAGCRGLGLEPFNRPAVASSTVVALKVPQGLEGTAIVAHLRERYRTVIAGSRSPRLHNKVIRIGTMGAVAEADIRADLMHLEATLKDLA
jgi:aspartate aminotransferase-like enzyme